MKAEAASIKRMARERIEAELRGRAQIHGGFGDVALQAKLNAKLEKLENETWLVQGRKLTRPEVMAEIIEKVCDGHSLPDISYISGMPSVRSMVAWRKTSPEFDDAMREAEVVRGIMLAERSLQEAMKAEGAKDAPAQKLKADQLRWMASKYNKMFEDRQVHEHKLDITKESEERLLSKLSLILQANPVIRQQLGMAEDADVQDAEVVTESEGGTGGTQSEEQGLYGEGTGRDPGDAQG